MFFFQILHSYNIDRANTENRKTVLFCQNGQHFGNSTLFDLKWADPRSENFGQKKL